LAYELILLQVDKCPDAELVAVCRRLTSCNWRKLLLRRNFMPQKTYPS